MRRRDPIKGQRLSGGQSGAISKGKGYSHRRGANKDNFFVIRTAAVLHGGANKQNFPVMLVSD